MLHGSVSNPIEVGVGYVQINEWAWLIAQSLKIGSLTRYLENLLTDWVDTWHSDASWVSEEPY